MNAVSANSRWYALVLGLVVALILLGFLQYHSSRQLSNATSDQMKMNLHGSLMNLRRGVENELSPIFRALQPASRSEGGDELADYVAGYSQWRSGASHPALISDVMVWHADDRGASSLMRLDTQKSEFQPSEWPTELSPLHERLAHLVKSIADDVPHEGAEEPGSPAHGDRVPFALHARMFRFPWMIDEHALALVQATVYPARHAGTSPLAGAPPVQISWLIVKLDREVLAQKVIADLAQRYFSGRDGMMYRVAVVDTGSAGSVIFSTDGKFGTPAHTSADGSLNMFGAPFSPDMSGHPVGPSQPLFGPPQDAYVQKDGLSSDAAETLHSEIHSRMHSMTGHGNRSSSPTALPENGPFRLQALRFGPGERGWVIIAQNNQGSLQAAVAAIFYRNLVINFGVLSILAITIALIVINSARARRLAQLQVDFVAGVSHELRTPLTGIVSAAQNISDGLVDNQDQMERYGRAILSQARQLNELVEQILLFSAVEKGAQRYHLQPANVPEIVDAGLNNCAPLLRDAEVQVVREVESGLPQVYVDSKALVQCLVNLITNAVKYGGDQRWLRIRAWQATNGAGKADVCVAVEDRGIGIDSADLAQIFQPFFRSGAVTASQIHGNGLGLPLAKTIAEAMGGRLTVQSTPAKGSIFTVHLPVNERTELRREASVHADSESRATSG
jgi:two-component system sensor histidine kinase SenX3